MVIDESPQTPFTGYVACKTQETSSPSLQKTMRSSDAKQVDSSIMSHFGRIHDNEHTHRTIASNDDRTDNRFSITIKPSDVSIDFNQLVSTPDGGLWLRRASGNIAAEINDPELANAVSDHFGSLVTLMKIDPNSDERDGKLVTHVKP